MALLVPLLTAGAPPTVTPAAAPAAVCASAPAERLRTHLGSAVSGRAGTVAMGLHDRTTGTTCTLRSGTSFDAASVVKVTRSPWPPR
jgi:hypothetical protein